MGILNAIQRVSDDEGADYLKKYYLSEAGYYTGSEFERIGAEPGKENTFTAADLYSEFHRELVSRSSVKSLRP